MLNDLTYAEGCSPEDRRVAIASLKALQRRAIIGTIGPLALAVMNEMDSDWQTPMRDRRWSRILGEAVSWVSDHSGKIPNKGSSNREEAFLGNWIRTQRTAAGADRRAKLDAAVAGWDERDPATVWANHLEAAKHWFALHSGRFPLTNAKDDEELRVREWLDNQKNKATPARVALLDTELPGWRGKTADAVWDGHLEKLLAWRAANANTFPKQAVLPEGQWMSVQRRPGLKPARASKLDAVAPGWRDGISQS